MLSPVHINVQGRARFKVEGLCGSAFLKKYLESRLCHCPHIKHASASVITGNLLVNFNSNNDHRSVSMIIEDVLREFESANGQFRETKQAMPPANPDSNTCAPCTAETIEGGKGLLNRFRGLFGLYKNQPKEPWHTLAPASVVEMVESEGKTGLVPEQARERLTTYGPNSLPEPKIRSNWDIFTSQFISLPVGLLGAAAGLSIITGGIFDAAVILAVVGANALIGYYTESAAEKTIRSLRDVVHPSAAVVRAGQVADIPCEDVVIGDLLVLRPGTYVAGDARILLSSHLSIDESVLTGESMPVAKDAGRLRAKDLPLADRNNMVFRGTLVTGGEGVAVVVATGQFTEMGMLRFLLDETTSPETPMERQLRIMGDQLVLMCGAICGLVFLLGLVRGYGFLRMLRTGISLAAAAVPEGLPAAATINFALGIRTMQKHRVLIRHLQAVETLGAIHYVCLDKTGTITENRMTVLRVYAGMRRIRIKGKAFFMDDAPIEPRDHGEVMRLTEIAALCNETEIFKKSEDEEYKLSGSSTENALIQLAIHAGVDVLKLRGENQLLQVNHRAENRLYMSTRYKAPDGTRIFALKGSPPEVLGLCQWHWIDGERRLLTEADRLEIDRENQVMAGEALRVLGVAFTTSDPKDDDLAHEKLTWLGLIGMTDPIRKGVKDLIGVYHRAGMNTVMITGDQTSTAYAVARQLDLSNGRALEILESKELEALGFEVLEALAKKAHVYSRVSPSHKLKIVQALQAGGNVVAMTGDGINDGPALKAADIGIAMGRSGTDVAREVADVVLEDDDLESLKMAIRDGRTTYSNIRKSVHFFLATNLSEIMVMFSAAALGIGFPLTVMQLLWINIISDIFPGLALSMEEADPDVLDQPPRDPGEPIFSAGDYRKMALESGVITGGAMAAYGYGIARYGMGARAGSLAFQGLTMGQLLHAVSCRSETRSIFDKEKAPPNPYLDLALGGSLALQILTMILPGLRRFLGITPLSLMDGAVIAGSAVMPLALNESYKRRTRD